MSLRTPQKAFAPQPRDKFYTPPHAVERLLEHDCFAVKNELRRFLVWECAAGRGDIAKVLVRAGLRVMATDIAPDRGQLHPVLPLDFLAAYEPSGERRLAIITNPPFGKQSDAAIHFIEHGLAIMERVPGFMALLLPFEFDARPRRSPFLARHPMWLGKLTIGERIRWVNLPQKKSAPMGHHAWFMWASDFRMRTKLRHPFMDAV